MKLQLLKGNHVHLVVIPKLGSSAIRNFYSKNVRHAESAHKNYKTSNKDIHVVCYKPLRDIFVSSIQTDFRASVTNRNNPPNFPKYRNSVYRLPENQRERWVNLIETNTPDYLSDNWNTHWGDKNGFFGFADHIIGKAFNLSNDISWFVTGHFSDSWLQWPELYEEKEVVFTDISSLSNPKFIKWLKKTDNFWEYLDVDICNTPREFGDDNKWNVKPSNYENIINEWIDRLDKADGQMFKFDKNYSNIEFNYTTETEYTTLSANTQFLKSLERTFQLCDINNTLIKDTPKYLKF